MKTRYLVPAMAVLLAFLVSPALAQQSQEKRGSKQAPEVPVPPPKGKKLVLKDGTSQMARSYERKGDRVRYYSVERSVWEEIPADLVDWEATRQAEAEAAKQLAEGEEKMRAAAVAKLASELDVDASIEVAPGVFLPEEDGLFALQCPAGGELRGAASSAPTRNAGQRCIVVPLAQIVADTKQDKTRTLLQVISPIPIVPGRQKVVAQGNRAVLRLFSGQPEFYMRTVDRREPEMELIRTKVKGNTREVEFVSTYITGQKFSKYDAVSIERWEVAKGVYRLTISQTLEPGEYVLAEYLPMEGLNVAVWDFGVDASAENPAPVKKPATKKR